MTSSLTPSPTIDISAVIAHANKNAHEKENDIGICLCPVAVCLSIRGSDPCPSVLALISAAQRGIAPANEEVKLMISTLDESGGDLRRDGYLNKAEDMDDARSLLLRLSTSLAAAEALSRRWYQADGSFIEMSKEEVLERRKAAAQLITEIPTYEFRLREMEAKIARAIVAIEACEAGPGYNAATAIKIFKSALSTAPASYDRHCVCSYSKWECGVLHQNSNPKVRCCDLCPDALSAPVAAQPMPEAVRCLQVAADAVTEKYINADVPDDPILHALNEASARVGTHYAVAQPMKGAKS